ncbi:LON peptidase substrate-binding domain-containing protein [Variovorax sp. VNK109]|uniref:LON peptidase substrate-binding domain-containing protein n=1 Tax=Variovorax sp. VNK109 TaxID=3400919 RepID=UPI003C0C8C64
MSEALTLHSLPLFPLGTVLFPGGQLPLRIFEVRYLDMITRCHKAGAPFGVVSLTQGHEVRLPGVTESFVDIGTLAAIEELSQPQPGLLSIRCAGTQRFRVMSSERLKHGLWVADVQRVDDDPVVSVPEDLVPIAQSLAEVIRKLRERAPQDATPPLPTEMKLDDCGWVANRWCELLPLPAELKQRLMVLDNPLVRLELVGDILARTGIASQ